MKRIVRTRSCLASLLLFNIMIFGWSEPTRAGKKTKSSQKNSSSLQISTGPPGSTMIRNQNSQSIWKGLKPKQKQKKITKALKSSSRWDRTLAAEELIRMGKRAGFAVKAITPMLYEKYPISNRLAVRALVGMGPQTIPVLLEVLKKGKQSNQVIAIRGLGHFGPKAAKGIPLLKKAAQVQDHHMKEAALQTLSRMGKHARPFLPMIIKNLESPYGWIQQSAVENILRYKQDAAPAIPYLAQRLLSSNGDVSQSAQRALIELKQLSRKHLQDIIQKTSRAQSCSSNTTPHPYALAAAKTIASMDLQGLQYLQKLLKGSHKRTQITAATAFITAPKKRFYKQLPALLGLMPKLSPHSQKILAKFMCKQGKDLIPALVQAIKKQKYQLKTTEHLQRLMACQGTKALPSLYKMLKKKKQSSQTFALHTLQQYTTPIDKVANWLLKRLWSRSMRHHQTASTVSFLLLKLTKSKRIKRRYKKWALRHLRSSKKAPKIVLALRILRTFSAKVYLKTIGKMLKHKSPQVQLESLRLLGQRTHQLKKRIVLVQPFLKSKSKKLLHEAITALSKFGAKAENHYKLVLPFLKHKSPPIRHMAISALSRMQPESVDIALLLFKGKQKSKGKDRAYYQKALQYMAKVSINAFVPNVHANQAFIRAGVARILGGLGKSGAIAIPSLLPMLFDKKLNVRIAAIQVFGQFGTKGRHPDFIKALHTKLLKDKNPAIRINALAVLAKLQLDTPKTAKAVVKALKDKAPSVRLQALVSAKICKKHLNQLIPAIFARLKDKERSVQYRSLSTLADLGLQSPKALLTFEKYAASREFDFRKQATLPLARAQKHAQRALPFIKKHLRGKQLADQIYAVQALQLLRAKGLTALPLLTHLFTQKHRGLMCNARKTWRLLTDDRRPVFPILRKGLSNSDTQIFQGSILGLSKLNEASIPTLLNALEDKNPRVRAGALQVITKMPWKSLSLLPRVVGAHKDPNKTVQKWASKAYQTFGSIKAFFPIRKK